MNYIVIASFLGFLSIGVVWIAAKSDMRAVLAGLIGQSERCRGNSVKSHNVKIKSVVRRGTRILANRWTDLRGSLPDP